MNILLTDRLACPRCGPGFGLVLLAHEVRDRRVLQGDLGCPNCRDTYPVREGFADLRPPPRSHLPPPGGGSGDPLPPGEVGHGDAPPALGEAPASAPDEAVRLGALLGVTEGPGMLLLKGPAARQGKALAELIGQVEVVAMDAGLRGENETEGVSRVMGRRRIPFFSGSFRGVVLSGELESTDLEEACRVVAPLGRVVVLGAPPDTAGHLQARGMSILLDQDGVLAARRERSASAPLTPLRGLHGLPTLP